MYSLLISHYLIEPVVAFKMKSYRQVLTMFYKDNVGGVVVAELRL